MAGIKKVNERTNPKKLQAAKNFPNANSMSFKGREKRISKVPERSSSDQRCIERAGIKITYKIGIQKKYISILADLKSQKEPSPNPKKNRKEVKNKKNEAKIDPTEELK